MPRIARVVIPNYPHHIVQRGNRSQKVFFKDKDYEDYLNLLHEHICRFNIAVAAYCLMPNHVHLVAIPAEDGNLAKAIGETHRKYTRMINFREKWRGYLWQGRFSSYVLDERYLLAAVRYILLNPVKANIVEKPWDYRWSSAKHHLKIKATQLINDNLLGSLIDDWEAFLETDIDQNEAKTLRLHERTGRPLVGVAFIEKFEAILGISLKKEKPGPKTTYNN